VITAASGALGSATGSTAAADPLSDRSDDVDFAGDFSCDPHDTTKQNKPKTTNFFMTISLQQY
jgi:hypothetical protein